MAAPTEVTFAAGIFKENVASSNVAEPGVTISSGVCEDLINISPTCEPKTFGFLVGPASWEERDIFIVNCAVHTRSKSNTLVQDLRETIQLLPAGFDVCGVYCISPAVTSESALVKESRKILTLGIEDVLQGKNFLVCHLDKGNPLVTEDTVHLCNVQDNEVVRVKVHRAQEDSLSFEDSLIFRLRPRLQLRFENVHLPDKCQEKIAIEIEDLQDRLQSNAAVFHIQNSSVLLSNQSENDSSLSTLNTEGLTCADLLNYIDDEEEGSNSGSKKKKKSRSEDPVGVNVLFQVTGDLDTGIGCAPIIHYEHSKEDFELVELDLPLDVLVLISQRMPLQQIVPVLVEGLCRQLDAMHRCICKHKQAGNKFIVPRPYHFRHPGSDTLLTVVYPDGITEDSLQPMRSSLHKLFNIPADRPVFRRANALVFPSDQVWDGCLKNTHIGLPDPGVKDGHIYTVQGTYSYHHYMQDHFDDDKWGCAYRSLQTLISWFRLQGYTDVPIPTHRQIQQALVDIGDKEPSFVGSRKWIGSTEVSYCLDHLLGVQSKIMFVSSGADLGNKGRELAHHFQTQGTPVMIGGGVLAHTILGVDFSEVTGELKFLILDPHYTGGEDLRIIQEKGWCGWKTTDFWDKNAYYNLCLPQRPKTY
ncbi:ufm1-specific protease 2-like isoform X1 [Lingula anatina]|uniref:Ufm1-specific protease 2-like isoform X1 n=1 Tax=Lingula anatina TaxID=7574 RepID=A0A2R2MLB3_LINAN|nr:ufm1-specific protease 2-like isoform X1 [Lingula anatina]|eukprot:XP_023930998.1 ufm1-specific protease 2-like isoform X1 [Lingula anatina]